MIREPIAVRLVLESHPENVALVRSALAGVTEALDLSAEMSSDLKTALSEACNNVTLHAYDGGSGPMIVEIAGSSAGVAAAVIDHGSGITQIASGQDHMGLGLAVISALASRSEFRHAEGGGTEVRMFFADSRSPSWAVQSGPVEAGLLRAAEPVVPGDGQVLATFAPPAVTRYVLGRMVASIAAASHFSVTKISDLKAANDALAEYVESAADGQVDVAITSSARRVEVTVARLSSRDPGTARAALAGVVDGLSAGAEELRIELLDRTRDTG